VNDLEGKTPRRPLLLETWRAAPRNLILTEGELHVWRVSLAQSPQVFDRCWATLSSGERQNARRFHFERDTFRYVLARGVLRKIVGHYLGLDDPMEVRFTQNHFGKPGLPENDGDLRFNVSHSHDLALYACARGRDVGVDIEQLRDDLATQQIADQFFSAAESRAISLLPMHQRTRAFFRCWTRKEAYIKAVGEGLSSQSLSKPPVFLENDESADSVAIDPQLTEGGWTIMDLHPFPECAAALAFRGVYSTLSFWDWHEDSQGG
jgi:4'-phosphopantetheinyl transferase